MMISHVRKRYKNFKFSRKFAAKMLCFAVFLYFLSFIFNQINTVNYFPIKEVKVAGVQHIDHKELQNLLKPLVKKGFFIADVDDIKERLMQFPWVADASVRRVWPNEIQIKVSEQHPLATWNEMSLLSSSGQIFAPARASYPLGLPKFIGPEGEQMRMLQHYTLISNLLSPLNFKITRLELTPARSWKLTFANGIKLTVGHKDVLTTINHFVKVYPKIVGNRANEIDYIDLRYPNGLAVRWKT